MPVYSVNRRRAILLLVLTSVLLLTLDFRGNPLIDRARSVFARVLSPFETAGDVIITPIRNAWHGATDYEDQQREIERLRDLLAQQTGDQLAARAIVSDYLQLLTLNGLTARYPTVTARVVGGASGNFRQTVEIDRGSNDGILVGMPVVNFAGLVGKITAVYNDRSVVLLITDQEYAIECKVSGASDIPVTGEEDDPDDTTPSGVDVDDLSTTSSSSTTSTTISPDDDSDTVPEFDPDDPDGDGVAGGTTTTSTTTTTTMPEVIERETGRCGGRGIDRLPAMDLVTENPAFGSIEVGNVITTSGGSRGTSLAPVDLVIGEVINKVDRAGSAGPLLEIQLAADLEHLSLVQVVQYRPQSEVPG